MTYEHTETFTIDRMKVVLGFYKSHGWSPGTYSCDIIEGDTGTGNCSGFATLEKAISDCVRQHRYSYNFFKKGYAAAKSIDRENNP